MALAACVAAAAAPAAPGASRPLATGFADRLLADPDPAVRDGWAVRARADGASYGRVAVSWRTIARSKPTDPRDPDDPAYDFGALDAAVRSIAITHMRPLLTVSRAPAWAEGPRRPPLKKAPTGTWKPRPAALGDFAEALARRYTGSFHPGGTGEALPRVLHLQAWLEPNLWTHLMPQWNGKRPVAARNYRRLLNAFAAGVQRAGSGAKVIGAGLAPYGDGPGSYRIRPLRFWREVFCLRGRRALRARGCGRTPRAHLDILAHHPINTSGGPGVSAVHPDDVSTPDLGELIRLLRAAERQGRVVSDGRVPLWVTEFWWESNPPDRRHGEPPARQARYIAKSLYLFWKAGARVAVNLQIADDPEASLESPFQSGVYFASGKPKPARAAMRFPFVAVRSGPRRVRVWGRPPRGGEAVIERRRGGRWRRVGVADAGLPGPSWTFSSSLKLRGPAELRARVGTGGGTTSNRWSLGG